MPKSITMPTDLHMSTGDRLRLVADLIEAHPDHWDQGGFYVGEVGLVTEVHEAAEALDESPLDTFIRSCGATGCAAGWCLLTMPKDQVTEGDSYESQARGGFGLDRRLGEWLFYSTISFTVGANGEPAAVFAERMRKLADLPEPRTYDAAFEAGLLHSDYKS